MAFPLEGNWGWCSLGGKAENKDVCSRRRAIVWILALAHRGMSGGEQGSVSTLPLPPTLLLNRSLNPMGFLSQTAHRSMLNLSLLTHCLATNTSLVVLFPPGRLLICFPHCHQSKLGEDESTPSTCLLHAFHSGQPGRARIPHHGLRSTVRWTLAQKLYHYKFCSIWAV